MLSERLQKLRELHQKRVGDKVWKTEECFVSNTQNTNPKPCWCKIIIDGPGPDDWIVASGGISGGDAELVVESVNMVPKVLNLLEIISLMGEAGIERAEVSPDLARLIGDLMVAANELNQ